MNQDTDNGALQVADRFRKLERLAAGRPLRSPSKLAPRPADALTQRALGLEGLAQAHCCSLRAGVHFDVLDEALDQG
jgi:hypothetical protein